MSEPASVPAFVSDACPTFVEVALARCPMCRQGAAVVFTTPIQDDPPMYAGDCYACGRPVVVSELGA